MVGLYNLAVVCVEKRTDTILPAQLRQTFNILRTQISLVDKPILPHGGSGHHDIRQTAVDAVHQLHHGGRGARGGD